MPKAILFNEQGLKPCGRCKEMLPRSQFNRDSSRKSGHTSSCRACHVAMAKDRASVYQQKFMQDGPEHSKQCRVCKAILPSSAFYANRTQRDGLQSSCSKCGREAWNSYRSESYERFLGDFMGRVKNAHGTGRRRQLLSQSTVTKDDLVAAWRNQDGQCNLTKLPMTHVVGKGQIATNASVDRIDNNKGYHPENIQLVCNKANLMKGSDDDETTYRFCKAYVERYEAEKGRK